MIDTDFEKTIQEHAVNLLGSIKMRVKHCEVVTVKIDSNWLDDDLNDDDFPFNNNIPDLGYQNGT